MLLILFGARNPPAALTNFESEDRPVHQRGPGHRDLEALLAEHGVLVVVDHVGAPDLHAVLGEEPSDGEEREDEAPIGGVS